ncbi:hypothetical protein ACWCPT_23690 [Streptomyces sp. NPDC002308]
MHTPSGAPDHMRTAQDGPPPPCSSVETRARPTRTTTTTTATATATATATVRLAGLHGDGGAGPATTPGRPARRAPPPPYG